MFTIWALLLLTAHPLTAHSDYPACNDLSTYKIYGGNTSHKGLESLGFNSVTMSQCDLSSSSYGNNCGVCDFKKIKPDQWYRFSTPLQEIVEISSSEIEDKCPAVGHCNGRNQVVLSRSQKDTLHKGSWFYRIVLSKNGKCEFLGDAEEEHDLVEKNQCDGFFLYRFPKLFEEKSCATSQKPWVPTSICMDDSRKLSPFWVYLMVVVSSALLLLILVSVAFSIYRHRQMILEKRRRSTHMYHQAAEANRQSTHSYADLVTMGFQVSVPAPTHSPIPLDTGRTSASENGNDDGSTVLQNDSVVEPTTDSIGNDPVERVSMDGLLEYGLVSVAPSPRSNTDYMIPDELTDSRRNLALHNYLNVARPVVPQISVDRSTQGYMIPDELMSRSPHTSTSLATPALISSASSDISSALDPIAFRALFAHSMSSIVSSPSDTDRSVTPDFLAQTSSDSRLRVPSPADLVEGETCCIESCTECPESQGDSESRSNNPKLGDKPPRLEADPLAVSWNKSSGWRGNSRKCCNCRCSDRQADRYFRIQSV